MGVILSVIWAAMVVISLIFGQINHTLPEVSAAVASGASGGAEVCLTMAGTLCLWSGVMEVLRRSGALKVLGRGLRPVLGALYPDFREDEEVMGAVCANVSANLLGLGNAATPFGVRAACAMTERGGSAAADGLCMLVVCNTASIQLIPATVAALRGAAGSANPLDILPAVWLSSALSVCAGITAAKLLSRLWRTPWRG